MVEIAVERAPVNILSVANASATEIIEFLERYSPGTYKLVNERPLVVQLVNDGSTRLNLVSTNLLVHDPLVQGVQVFQNVASLRRLGLSPQAVKEQLREALMKKLATEAASQG